MCLRWEVLAATTAEICNTSGRDSDLETCEFSGSLTFPKVATFNELALLSKNIFDSGESLHYIYRDIHDQIEDIDVWILGANFNDTTKIDAKKSLKCGYYTCYEKSLENGKICKPGRFIFLVFFK